MSTNKQQFFFRAGSDFKSAWASSGLGGTLGVYSLQVESSSTRVFQSAAGSWGSNPPFPREVRRGLPVGL